MDNEMFIEECKNLVRRYANNNDDGLHYGKPLFIHVVWSCKTLQNSKALLVTSFGGGFYYEVTYDGDKSQMYLDVYKKTENRSYLITD